MDNADTYHPFRMTLEKITAVSLTKETENMQTDVKQVCLWASEDNVFTYETFLVYLREL